MRGLIVITALLILVAVAMPSSAGAVSWSTTVDFEAVGPEARVTSLGVERPRRFAYAPVPVSYDVTAWQVRWKHWGATVTFGRGRIQFCIIMSPCYSCSRSACSVGDSSAAPMTRATSATPASGQLSSSDPGFTGRATDYSRPRSFRVAGDALNIVRIHFYRLRWRHWGSLRAVARGSATTCTTTSTGTHCTTRRVSLIADQFAPCGDVNLYQQLRAYGVAGFPSPFGILVADQNCGVALDAARAARSIPLIQDVTGAHYKPASFCPANHTCFSHTRWKRWGAIAVGHGTAHFKTPTGTSRTFRTKITLSRIRRLCGGLRYTRAAWNGGQTFFIQVGGCGSWTGG